MRSKERTTIKDVAREANVTAQTVSRVCRNLGNVAPKTKERVLEACRKLNYLPNKTAISLRSGMVDSVAVVFDSLRNVYFSIMTDYINEEIAKHDYDIRPFFVRRSVIDSDIYLAEVSSGVSAVISFLEPADELESTVELYGVPMMVFGRRTELPNVDYVTTDDVEGGRLAAEELVAHGCNNIAFVGEAFGMTCVQDRLKGFSEGLAAHGKTFHTVVHTDWLAGNKEAKKMLEKSDGIFCFNDVFAYDILSAIDCSNKTIVGYDDLQSDLPMPVTLTSVGVDKRAYVALAVNSLFERIYGNNTSPVRQKYPVTLRHAVAPSERQDG